MLKTTKLELTSTGGYDRKAYSRLEAPTTIRNRLTALVDRKRAISLNI